MEQGKAGPGFSYTHPVTRDQVERRVAEKIREYIQLSESYSRKAVRYRFGSWFFRVAALLLLLAGIALPLIWQLSDWGYLALVAAGLAVLTDQVFVHTDSWVRLRRAHLKSRAIAEDLELDMMKFLATTPDEKVPQEKVLEMEARVQAAQENIQTVESEELESWRESIAAAWDALKERISQESGRLRDEAEAMKKVGVLQVGIDRSDDFDDVTIEVDGKASPWGPNTRSRVFSNLPVGNRVVALYGPT